MPRGGYAWWYIDALSEDGAHGLAIIAFIGSVFSPYYAFSRARGRGHPENHVAMNVALYGTPSRWAMTERGRAALGRSARHLAIGPSAMRWTGDALTIDIDEVTVPIPSRLRGTITLTPRALSRQVFPLDAGGRHRWRPIAPLSDVVVAMDKPGLHWRGTGYFDTNNGDEPLEKAFRSWTWSRFDLGDRARIVYDVIERDGQARSLSLAVTPDAIRHAAPLIYQPTRAGLWGTPRAIPGDADTRPKLVAVLEDAPFYTRSKIRSIVDGIEADGVHESLCLKRASAAWVRALLPFRMPRRASGPPRHGGLD